MLASQIIDNGYHDSVNMVGKIPDLPKPHSLGGVSKRYLKKEITVNKKDLQSSFVGMKPEDEISQEQFEYSASDVVNLKDIHDAQQVYIKERGVENIVKLENTLAPVLVKIEFTGCLIDKVKHRQNIKDWTKAIKEKEELLDFEVNKLARDYPAIQGGKYTNRRQREEFLQLDLFGGEGYVVKNLNLYNINYSSPKQIEDLFTRIGAVKPTDDFGKVSFGENPIKTYVTNHPNSPLKNFVETLLEYREYDKLLGTYGQKLFDVSEEGRIRTSYGQCFTDTGRLNSAEILSRELGTNLANIPKRGDIRSVFIPDPGYSFVDCDLAGQEVLLAGDFSKEPVIMKAFKEGFDHHSFLASVSYSIVFNQEVAIKNAKEDIIIPGIGKDFVYNVKALREQHKSCLFAKFYGGGKMRVMNVLNQYLVNHWPPEMRLIKAEQISKALDRTLPVLTKFLKDKVKSCQEKGYIVANKLGRRRYFDDVLKAYGEIMNFPIQASGADCIKIALINLDKWLGKKAKELGIQEREFGFICMTIYDQNLLCLNDKYLEYAPEIPKIMAESITYFLEDLKGSSDMNIRKFWSK